MAVKRKISKDKYLLAFILTSMIFVLGLTLGMLFDNLRIKWAETETKEKEVDYLSLQFQYLYLTTLKDKNASCSVLYTAMEKSIGDLSDSLQTFINYKDETRVNKEEYEIVGRKYILDNLKYWLLAKRTKEECDLDVVNILYFYSESNCPICPNQGVILTYFKKIFGDKLLIFPIDVDYETNEPIITILKKQYKITAYPTIIIGDKKYEGVISNNELKKIICASFKYETEICPKK
ncbi:DsbA family protein [Candidatus Woesearchaeota archaeon]|nr:DsbA family protein [Candidatus Woesearchaeota archaeon]